MIQNPLLTVLMITALGMGLLFLALTFFYGLLAGMARGLRDRAVPPRQEPAPASEDAGEEATSPAAARWQAAGLQAAAVAIALARARVQAPLPGGAAPQAEAPGGPQAPSAWWSLHHQRRLASRASRRRGE
jgi:Na+-transporting methylmalonyl-CoA/oxaloacetate decarboxylase gamma subunit